MIYYCSECKLYWYPEGKEIEFRLYVFAPLILKKCPFCEDPDKPIPKELIEFRKKRRF